MEVGQEAHTCFPPTQREAATLTAQRGPGASLPASSLPWSSCLHHVWIRPEP